MVTKKTSKPKSQKASSSSREPKTMEALLAQFDGGVKPLERGQRIKGIVIGKTSKRLTLDIDRKSEGLVAEKAFNEAKDFIKTLEIGDEITTSVIIPETPEGHTILSLRQAKQDTAWERILRAEKRDKHLVVLGKSVNASGVMVEVGGLIGFVPGSQLGREVSKNPKDLIGEYFKVKVLEADRKAKKIVLSEKEVSEAEDIKLARSAFKKIEMGEIYEGKVITVTDFGCFVSIDVKLSKNEKVACEGLVHISELAWEKVENIRKEFSEGDKMRVKVIGTDKNRLALSAKQAQEDPWKNAEKKYKLDSKEKGKVVRVSDFGVFVQLEPGVEGLIHMTKIPPGTKLEKGQEVNVYVEEINSKAKKLSLGLVLTAKPVGYK